MSASLEQYFRDINRTDLLTVSEEQSLAKRIGDGDRAARDHLIRANLRLVVRIARGYIRRGLSLDDLISAGNLGLLRAVEGYQSGAGARFSTYASFWIKQAIRAAISNGGHVVRLPHYVMSLILKWRRAEVKLRAAIGREAAHEEIAWHLGLNEAQRQAVEMGLQAKASTLDASETSDLFRTMEDKHVPSPLDHMVDADAGKTADGMLMSLSAREADILRLRYGLNGGEPATLQDVGKRYGLSKERVRQLERDSLVALRERSAAVA